MVHKFTFLVFEFLLKMCCSNICTSFVENEFHIIRSSENFSLPISNFSTILVDFQTSQRFNQNLKNLFTDRPSVSFTRALEKNPIEAIGSLGGGATRPA